MTATDDAYEAPAGQFQSRVTITWPGGPNPIFDLIADVTIDRSIQDQPQSVTQIAGAAAAQATITLKSGNGTYLASMLSPFSTNAWSTRTVAGYGVNQVGVVVEEGVLVSGSYVYTTLFTGTVTNFQLGDDGSAQLSCTDRAASIQGTANLPAAGGIQTSLSGDTRLNPLAVVDLALRSGGYYLTPPATSGAHLVVSGIGGYLPEVGGFVSHGSSWANVASPWPTQLPTVDVCSSASFTLATALDRDGNWAFQCWVFAARPGAGSTTLLTIAGNVVSLASTGVLKLLGSPGLATSDTAVFPSGAAGWHFLSFVGGWWQVDGSTVASSDYTAPVPLSSTVSVSVWMLSLQVLPFATWALLYPWTPTFTAYLDSVPQRLSGIAKQTGAAWSLIQQLAQAYGDVAYWDGVGAFHYETRTTWAARRYVTPTYLKDDSRIISGSPSWGQDSLRRSVTANVVVPVATPSTTAAPAFTATDIYTIPARSTVTFNVDLDYTVYAIKPITRGYQTDANSSWLQSVAASAVGDPAAAIAYGVSVATAVGTSSGLAITIGNLNNYAISLWTGDNGGTVTPGPYLIIHGTKLVFPDPRVLTVQTGSASGDDLVLDDNTWRQDTTQALLWLNSIASDVALPQIIWGSVNIPVDPRLTIGTVVAVKDSPYMDVTHPVQIVGIAYDLPAEGMHTMTLTVRSAYAPTGWILDVPGRSELDSTTLLVV